MIVRIWCSGGYGEDKLWLFMVVMVFWRWLLVVIVEDLTKDVQVTLR